MVAAAWEADLATGEARRRLTAILFTDVVGSSRVTGADEQAGLRLRDRHRSLVRAQVERYGGRLVEAPGDETLSTFESALDAVHAALAIRGALVSESGLALHMGLHHDEVLFRDDEVFGEGVNIAARIRQLAAPGEILVSGEVANAVHNHPEIAASPRGEHKLRNIDRPVSLFALSGTPPHAVVERARPLLRGRSPWRLVAGGAAAAAAAAGFYVYTTGTANPSTTPAQAGERGVVAVLPFAVRGGDDLSYLREGMVELVSSKLAMSDTIRPVDPHSLLAYVTRELKGEVTPETAGQAARHFHAAHFVLGSAVQVNDQLHIEASLYASGEPREPRRRIALEGQHAKLLGLVDGVATDLMKGLATKVGRFDRLGAVTTTSPDALRAFLEGNAALRHWRTEQASELLERAVALDPEFALAWYRLAWSQLWSGDSKSHGLGRATQAMNKATALADRLPPRERDLFRAFVDSFEGRIPDAETRYRRILRDNADDWEAWNGLGELLTHYNPYRGRSVLEAKGPFERALALDPEHPNPRIHLLGYAFANGDPETAWRQAEWFIQNTDYFGLIFRVLKAYSKQGRDEQVQVLERVEAFGDYGPALYAMGGLPREPRKEVLALIARGAPELLWEARSVDALAEVGGGRLTAWRENNEVQQRELRGRDAALLESELIPAAYLSAFPFMPVSEKELRAQSDHLKALSTSRDARLGVAYRPYLAGLVSVRLQDSAAVEGALSELDRTKGPALAPWVPSELAASLRAYSAATRGDQAEALRILQTLPTRPLTKDLLNSTGEINFRLLDRFLTALAHEATGHYEQALGFHQNIGNDAERVLGGPQALGRAHLLEKLGRSTEAIGEYEKLIALWADCDPELRPRVEQAKARVAELRAALATPSVSPRKGY